MGRDPCADHSPRRRESRGGKGDGFLLLQEWWEAARLHPLTRHSQEHSDSVNDYTSERRKANRTGVDACAHHRCHCGRGAGDRPAAGREDEPGGQRHIRGGYHRSWRNRPYPWCTGILNFANIAHGDYMTIGAYVTLFVVGSVLPLAGIEGKGLGPFTFGYPLLIALPRSHSRRSRTGSGPGRSHIPTAQGAGSEHRGAVNGVSGLGHCPAGAGADDLGRVTCTQSCPGRPGSSTSWRWTCACLRTPSSL